MPLTWPAEEDRTGIILGEAGLSGNVVDGDISYLRSSRQVCSRSKVMLFTLDMLQPPRKEFYPGVLTCLAATVESDNAQGR